MDEVNQIRFSKRGEAFAQAQAMKERLIAELREELGTVKATQQASRDVSGWLSRQYEAIERELPN